LLSAHRTVIKRFDKLVLTGFIAATGAALLFFSAIFVLIHFFNRMGALDDAARAFAATGQSLSGGLARYYAVQLPFILTEAAPFATLMGAMWVVQQMARRGELVLVVTSGVSLRRLALPLLLAGFVLALLFSVVREEGLPRLADQRHRMEQLHRGRADEAIARLPMARGGDGNLLLIGRYRPLSQAALDVAIAREGRPEAPHAWVEELRWQGTGWIPAPGARIEGEVRFPLAPGLTPRDVEIHSRGLFQLSAAELKTELARKPGHPLLTLLLHGHYAYPMRAVVLLLIGLPLVLSARQRSAWVAIGLALALSIGFFSLQSIFFELARREEIGPALATWLPISCAGILGLIGLRLTAT
jgi:lipopolysaccharide export system permease protein